MGTEEQGNRSTRRTGGTAVAARACAGLPSSWESAIPQLLAEVPDPDSATLLFDRLLAECEASVTNSFERHSFLAHYAITIFGHSRYLGETLVQNPELLLCFANQKDLERSFSGEDFARELSSFRARDMDEDLALLLARFKRRQYVRIMLRDVLRIASLAETTAEISALSDVLIEAALKQAQEDIAGRVAAAQRPAVGPPAEARFSVLALGKLGGKELNYNSDLDLMYVYDDVETKEGVSTHEYFVRLAQNITDILGRVTREGPVFRIDLRLRPQGTQGELAVSLSHCRHYYAELAQDWERQALIKARYSAGDINLAGEFLTSVQSHVYRKEINFAAIKTALVTREKMHAKRRIAGGVQGKLGIDVKLDRGGIRDIEFLVQCLQRVYGGAEPWLRSSGTLAALHKLHDKGHLSGQEFQVLSRGYEFLRRVEHFLQLRQGLQTHRLPDDKRELTVLQRAMAKCLPGERVQDIAAAIQARMNAVSEIYQRVIYQQENTKITMSAATDFQLRGEASVRTGFEESIVQRLALDAPALYQLTRPGSLDGETRKHLMRFLSASFSSSEAYGVLLRHAASVELALPLFQCSGYLTDILVRHPEEIAVLENLPKDAPRLGSGELFRNLLPGCFGSDAVLAYVAESSLPFEEKLAHLRKRYRARELANGARDVIEARNVYESLAGMAGLAEDAVAAAFRMAGAPAGLAVMALGRLGTREFDILSDADLLFVVDEDRDMQAMAKAAETVIQTLAAYTQEGTLFAVDTRLRPHGSQGGLVVTLRQLQKYFAQEAQAWEALTYTKLRPIAGDTLTSSQALAHSEALFERFAGKGGFAAAVRDMRARLENVGESSFKSSSGGIYDIDFLTGYMLITGRVKPKNGSLRDRLWACRGAGQLQKGDTAALDHAAEFLRTLEHAVRVVEGRAHSWLPGRERARENAEKLTSQILGQTFAQGLEAELEATLQRVRQIYVRVLG